MSESKGISLEAIVIVFIVLFFIHPVLFGIALTLYVIGGIIFFYKDSKSDTRVAKREATARKKEPLKKLNDKTIASLSYISDHINELLSSDHYLAQSEIKKWILSLPTISNKDLNRCRNTPTLPNEFRESILKLEDIKNPKSKLIHEKNMRFVKQTMRKYSEFFSTFEKYPLTNEQMKAAIVNEDHNLLIAAAGSGKSSTIVAKAIYLVDSGLATPEEILVLVYNKDAQLAIEHRLNALIGITPRYDKPINAQTFHGLGMEVINICEKIKPAVANERLKSVFFKEFIEDVANRDPGIYQEWLQFILVSRKPMPPIFDIKNRKDYEDMLYTLGGRRRAIKQGGGIVLPTMDNNEVKSMEEVQISNWLFLNGVNYLYEDPYEHGTADKSHRQYLPDFYYPDARLYHEHFAINELGKPPKFMEKGYVDGINWKRQLHEKNGTSLIETKSADFRDGTVFEKLETQLLQHGIKLQPRNRKEIDDLIKRAFKPEKDTPLFTTFLRHFKASNADLVSIRNKSKRLYDCARTTAFLKIFEAFYKNYQSRLNTIKKVDFEDLINYSCEYLESGEFKHQYKYLLIDEFQDISQDKKRMIQAILNQRDGVKLFAVGDDWQSIYRFSGADVDIMTNFSKHFGFTSKSNLTKTFRSYQGIVDVASAFIQKNPRQLRKTISAHQAIESSQVVIKQYIDDADQQRQCEALLTELHGIAIKYNRSLDVFFLARYKHQKPSEFDSYAERFPKLEFTFNTIHKSKGLEADYVLILRLEDGRNGYGFPSFITDDPLLDLVTLEPESFPFAEERRLFYVALTRAKRGAYVFSDVSSPSVFVTELATIKGTKVHNDSDMESCPRCKVGVLKVRTRKDDGVKFKGCSNYPRCTYPSSRQ